MKLIKAIILFLFLLTIFDVFTFAQTINDLDNYNEPPSRLRGVIEKFSEDYGSFKEV